LKDDFGFSKVKGLQFTGEMGKSISVDVIFSPDLMYQKSLKYG